MTQRQTLSLRSIAPDLLAQDAPGEVWNEGNNVAFKDGYAVRVAGDADTLPAAAASPRACVFLRNLGQPFWVYCTATGIFAHDGETEFDITPAGGWSGPGPDETYTACVLGAFAYFNASDRDPVYWDGNTANPCQPLPDWPANGRCLALRAHKSFLFAIGMISEGGGTGQRVRWSDAAEAGTVPGAWTPAADNLAGFVDLVPLASPALDGHDLRDSFLIYKGESIWQLDFIGGQAVFNARIAFAEAGIAGTGALCSGPKDEHLFIGSDADIYVTDGVDVRSVLDGRAQRTFDSELSETLGGIFSGAYLAREKAGLLAYPANGGGTGTRALLFDFSSGDIGFRDMPDVLCASAGQRLFPPPLPRIWDNQTATWNAIDERWSDTSRSASFDDVLIGNASGFLVVGADTNAVLTARLAKAGLAFGDPQARKMITRVWPKLEGRTGDVVQFRLGGQEISGGPVRLANVLNFTIGQEEPLSVFVQGRFLSMEIESVTAAAWRLGSVDVEVKGVGNF